MKKYLLSSAITLMGVFQIMNAQNEADINDALKIPHVYDKIVFRGNGLMIVTQGNKEGVVDISGKLIVPIQYDNIDIPKEDDGCKYIEVTNRVLRNGEDSYHYIFGLYNTNGDMIAPLEKYQTIKTHDEYSFDGMVKIGLSNNKEALILENGTMTEPYERVSVIKGGVAIVEKDRKYGVINKKGDIIIPLQYKDIDTKNNNNIIKVETYQDGKRTYGLFNNKGEVIVPVGKYQSVSIEQSCIVVEQDNKKGVLNLRGIPIVQIGKYEDCRERECDDLIHYYIEVSSSGKKGVVNKNGKLIFPLGKYQNYWVIDEDVVIVDVDGKRAAIDTNGTEIVPFGKFEKLYAMYGVIVNCQNKKYGIVDKKGNQVLPIEYDDISPERHSYGMAFVKKDGKYGVVDCNGKIIIPLGDYEYGGIKGNIGYLVCDNKTMWFNTKGETLAPLGKLEDCKAKYGELQEERDLEHGLFKVAANGKVGVIKLW